MTGPPQHLSWTRVHIVHADPPPEPATCACGNTATFFQIEQPFEALIPAEDDPDGEATDPMPTGDPHITNVYCPTCVPPPEGQEVPA